jgi:glycosyltransferase involved in cell wall biosynthesis
MLRAAVRILLIINGLDVGGTERAVEQLAGSLAARGLAVHVVALKALGRTGHALAARGLEVTSLAMADVTGLGDLARGALGVARVVRRWRPDVVHSFLPRANIVSRVGNRLAGGRAAHLSAERSTDFRRTPRVVRLNRWTARWTDRVLAVSGLVRDVLVARDRLAPGRIAILENGIDLAAVDAVAPVAPQQVVPSLPAGETTFCAVGRFVPEKGFGYLVRAFARMRSRPHAHLVLVGEGPEEAAIRADVAAQGLGARVHFAGYRPDVLGLLKGSDAYVLSSVEEGSPMVVLEAMACGAPVIATDVSGVRELAGMPAESAVLVVPPAVDWGAAVLGRSAPGSEEERIGLMAATMDRVATSPELRRALGAAARRRAETHFTLPTIVDRTLAHYVSARHG